MTSERKKYRPLEIILSIGLALLAWQLAAVVIHQKILLVSPAEVFLRLLTIWKEPGFFTSILFTFRRIAAGFLLGLTLGILLAFPAARWRWAETLLWPWMASIKTVPVASFVVICLIWLSARSLSVFISFLVVLPMVYQNILEGLKHRDRKMQEMAEVFRIPPLRRLRYILIPQLRPYLISACRVSIGMAWKAGVAAEIIGMPKGSMGHMLYIAKIYLDTDDLLAWTVVIVVVSVLSEKAFLYLLGRLLGERRQEGAENG